MIERLPNLRLGGLPLTLLAVVSAVATVIIVSDGSTRTPAELAALAALRQRPAVAAPRPAPPATAAAAPAPAAAAPAPASPAPRTTAQASTPAAASASTSVAPAPVSTATAPAQTRKRAGGKALPKVGHIFEIALTTSSYAAAFGHRSAAPYQRSLVRRGTLLSDFQSLGAGELADYLAMVSGQSPNSDTSAGCQTYASFPQGTAAGAGGLVRGTGCVYPETALTIGDQVTASGHAWKAYVAGMGTQTCVHPNSGATDTAQLPGTQPGYDPAHNPFIYFHSLLDLGDCATDDRDLGALAHALTKRSRTATFSFVAPGLCDDPAATTSSGASTGSTGPSTSTTSTDTTPASTTSTSATSTSPSPAPACSPAGPVGIAAEDAFLRLWVPRILSSPAYRHNGVLIIAFAAAGLPHLSHPVRTGALVLSRYARAGRKIGHAFGPYSLLRSIEAMLGYTPLAHARGAASFAGAVLRR